MSEQQYSTGPALIPSPVGVGDAVPGFALVAQDWTTVSIPLSKPTLLVFFRGQW